MFPYHLSPPSLSIVRSLGWFRNNLLCFTNSTSKRSFHTTLTASLSMWLMRCRNHSDWVTTKWSGRNYHIEIRIRKSNNRQPQWWLAHFYANPSPDEWSLCCLPSERVCWISSISITVKILYVSCSDSKLSFLLYFFHLKGEFMDLTSFSYRAFDWDRSLTQCTSRISCRGWRKPSIYSNDQFAISSLSLPYSFATIALHTFLLIGRDQSPDTFVVALLSLSYLSRIEVASLSLCSRFAVA
jgi:hypothetical protein